MIESRLDGIAQPARPMPLKRLLLSIRHGHLALWGVAAIALMALLGWRFDLPPLTSWAADAVTIKPLVALCFLALVPCAADAGRRQMTSWLGWGVAAMAGLSLAQNVFEFDLGIDSRIAAWLTESPPGPGANSWRMASPTAVMMMVAGVAAGLLRYERWRWLVTLLAAMVGLLAVGELIVTAVSTRQALLDQPLFSLVPLANMTAFLLLAGELLRWQPLDLAAVARRPGAQFGIGGWLLALALCAALPVLIYAGTAAQRLAQAERQATLYALEQRTEATAYQVERSLRQYRDLTATLVNEFNALNGDLAAFHALADRVLVMGMGKVGGNVLLVDPKGNFLLDARQPFGLVLPDTLAGDPQGRAAVLATKAPHFSNLFAGATTGQPTFGAWAPVIRDGEVAALLMVTADPQDLTAQLREARLPEGWIGVVVDRAGSIVARTHAPEALVGQSASDALLLARRRGESGVSSGVTADGIQVTSYFRNLSDLGWTVAIGVPKAALEAPGTASFWIMFTLGLVSLVIAGGLAFVVGRQLSRQITGLVGAAKALGEGGDPSAAPTGVRELNQVVGALAMARKVIDARESALHDSEARLQLFVEHAPAAIAMFDRDMRYLAASRRWQEDFGLDRSPVGRSHYEVFPEVGESWKAVYRRCLAGATEQHDGERFERADGTVQWLKWEVRPWTDAEGAIGGLLIASEDVTEYRQAILSLRVARDSFRHLVENSPFGVYAVDAEFRLVNVSVGAQKVFENVRPLIGRDFAEVMRIVWPESFASEVIDRFRHTLETGESYHAPSTVERRHDISDVESYDWKIERVTMPDGRFGVVCHFYDLSERQRYEAALGESEARLKAVVDGAIDGIIAIDETGTVRSINPAAIAMFGYAAEEVVGQNVKMLMPEPYRAGHDDYLSSYLRTGVAKIIGIGREVEGRRKNGSTFPMELGISDVRAGDARLFIGVVRDITERRRSEEQADLLLKEVNHRAKNLLAVVQAVARQTAKKSQPHEFAELFTERLAGLAASQDLLVLSEWQGVDMGDLVRSQLAHLADLIGTRIVLDGPPVQLAPAAAQAIGMAIHELSTNAVKHGALSNAAGSVFIVWTCTGEGAQAQFTLQWSERGGPPCAPPKTSGFGHTVTVAMAEHSLDAEVSLSYLASGLVWRLTAPADRVVSAPPIPAPVAGLALPHSENPVKTCVY